MFHIKKQILSALLYFALIANSSANTTNLLDTSYSLFLSDIKENSIRNREWNEADWNKYTREQSAQFPIKDKDTFYRLVTNALINLNDHHSFLMNKDKLLNQTKKNVGLINTVRVENGIGIINIPNNMMDKFDTPEGMLSEAVVAEFHKQLNAIKHQVTKGWIIDLSQNSGGNMYPMIGSLSDFFVNQNLGGFYIYQYGKKPVAQKMSFDGRNFKYDDQVDISFKMQYPIGTINLPTVVIISHDTASSGEILALALERQPNVKIIGQASFGLATCNSMMTLPNQLGHYMLTIGNDLDKSDNPLLSEKVIPNILIDTNTQDPIQVAKSIIEEAE